MQITYHFPLLVIFLVISCYFIAIQFFRYIADDDVSVVSFKQLQFDSLSEDQYPPYTVCFNGMQGKMLHNIHTSMFHPNVIIGINVFTNNYYIKGTIHCKNKLKIKILLILHTT